MSAPVPFLSLENMKEVFTNQRLPFYALCVPPKPQLNLSAKLSKEGWVAGEAGERLCA